RRVRRRHGGRLRLRRDPLPGGHRRLDRRRAGSTGGVRPQHAVVTVPRQLSRLRDERGMVTAETAVVLPVLLLVLAGAVAAVTVVGVQLRCVDAAREGARAAARGETSA